MKFAKFIGSSLFGLAILLPQTVHAGILSNVEGTVKQIVTSPITVNIAANAKADLTQPSLVISSDANAGAGSVLTLQSNNCLQLNGACPTQSTTNPGSAGETSGGTAGGGSGSGSTGASGDITQAAISDSNPTVASLSSGPGLVAPTDNGLVFLPDRSTATSTHPKTSRPILHPIEQAASRAGLALAVGLVLAAIVGVGAKLIYPDLTLDTVLWSDH